MDDINKFLQACLMEFASKIYTSEVNHVINKEPSRKELDKLEMATSKMYADTYLETIGLKENKIIYVKYMFY